MRIIVNDIAAEMGGAIAILKDFYEYVLKHGKEHEWIFLLSHPYLEETDHIKVKVYQKNRIKRIFFDLLEGRRLERKYHPDLFFSFQNTIFWGVNVPQAVYLQQSIPFQKVKKYHIYKRSELKLWLYQCPIGYLIKKSLRKADYIIVQTNWMKQAVMESVSKKSEVIDILSPQITDFHLNPDLKWNKDSFFVPITDISYKNAICVYEACKLLVDKDLQVYITMESNSEVANINFIGYISQEKIAEYYQTSTMIFPSYIETYGLPLAEARKIGTVILASDCLFSREILEGYENAYYFDAFKPEELSKLMERVLNQNITKKNVQEPIKTKMTWKRAIDKFEEFSQNTKR